MSRKHWHRPIALYFHIFQDCTFLNKKEVLRVLNRFLELDKDFKKGEFDRRQTYADIFICISSSRSFGQREAEKSSVSIQPGGKMPRTERKPIQVKILQNTDMDEPQNIYVVQEADLQDLFNGRHRQPWSLLNSISKCAVILLAPMNLGHGMMLIAAFGICVFQIQFSPHHSDKMPFSPVKIQNPSSFFFILRC